MDSHSFTIGQLARAAGVNVETVRYYERRGLIRQPFKPIPRGFRQYDEGHLQQILLIKRLQYLGFTLQEIGELLSLRADDRRRCQDVRRQAETKMEEVDDKIQSLHEIRQALERLVEKCHREGHDSECPILDELEQRNMPQ